MYTIVEADGDPTAGPNGWLVSDEVDMWAGPGNGAWTGKTAWDGSACASGTTDCGYTVQRQLSSLLPKDGRLRWANYGKGVLFWQPDALAARFVNDFQDIVSVDAYWATDNNLCTTWEGGRFFNPHSPRPLTAAECRRPSNYGALVERARSLVKPAGSKPVWAFVELGHPSGERSWPSITAAQVEAAVWSSIIHGARGITYFNHSFGGPCVTTQALRDPCYRAMRATVTRLNARITALAPVLNAPTVVGMVNSGPGVDTLTKVRGRDLYVFAQSTNPRPARHVIRLGCRLTSRATVVGSRRTAAVAGGSIVDTFTPGSPTRIYLLRNAATACAVGR